MSGGRRPAPLSPSVLIQGPVIQGAVHLCIPCSKDPGAVDGGLSQDPRVWGEETGPSAASCVPGVVERVRSLLSPPDPRIRGCSSCVRGEGIGIQGQRRAVDPRVVAPGVVDPQGWWTQGWWTQGWWTQGWWTPRGGGPPGVVDPQGWWIQGWWTPRGGGSRGGKPRGG